jgi:hypothetical protein
MTDVQIREATEPGSPEFCAVRMNSLLDTEGIALCSSRR